MCPQSLKIWRQNINIFLCTLHQKINAENSFFCNGDALNPIVFHALFLKIQNTSCLCVDFWIIIYFYIVSDIPKCHNTFSGLAIIKLFTKMLNFIKVICLRCWNLRKSQWKENYKIWWKTHQLLGLSQMVDWIPILNNW